MLAPLVNEPNPGSGLLEPPIYNWLVQGTGDNLDLKLATEVGSFPGGSVVKNLPANAGDVDLISGSGRSPGEGNGNPLQCSCLEISWTEKPARLQSMESQKSQTQLSN